MSAIQNTEQVLDSIKRPAEFRVKLSNDSSKVHTLKVDLNFKGMSIADLIKWAERSIVIAIQRRLRDSANDEKEFAELVNELNGSEIVVSEYVKPKERQAKPETKAKEMLKAIKMTAKYSTPVAEQMYKEYILFCKENGIKPEPKPF